MDYEILLRGDKDGNYKGGHVIAVAGEDAKPLTEANWPAVAVGINAATIARVIELEAELSAESERYQNSLEVTRQAEEIFANQGIPARDKIDAVRLLHGEIQKPVNQRKREELLRKRAEIDAQIDAIPTRATDPPKVKLTPKKG